MLSWELPPPNKGRGSGSHTLGVITSTHSLQAAGEYSSHLSDLGAPGDLHVCTPPSTSPAASPSCSRSPSQGSPRFLLPGPRSHFLACAHPRTVPPHFLRAADNRLLLAFNSHHPPPIPHSKLPSPVGPSSHLPLFTDRLPKGRAHGYLGAALSPGSMTVLGTG